MSRFKTIDLCRGLLFIFMMNTHALSIADLPSSHWLFSDFWLPNGWATLVFVVLSGYGVGFLFSPRPSVIERNAALRRRSRQILAVMFVSNILFAALREVAAGNAAVVASLGWWIGFITLDTEWTISGVLLPTGLVLLCGPAMIRWTQQAPWRTLGALLAGRFIVALAVISIGDSPYSQGWAARFFLLEGLGMFPVLPFVLNGCLGIWLGVQRHQPAHLPSCHCHAHGASSADLSFNADTAAPGVTTVHHDGQGRRQIRLDARCLSSDDHLLLPSHHGGY